MVEEHGATEGCAGCARESGVHNPRCRNRFESIFAKLAMPASYSETVHPMPEPNAVESSAAAVDTGDGSLEGQVPDDPMDEDWTKPELDVAPKSSPGLPRPEPWTPSGIRP